MPTKTHRKAAVTTSERIRSQSPRCRNSKTNQDSAIEIDKDKHSDRNQDNVENHSSEEDSQEEESDTEKYATDTGTSKDDETEPDQPDTGMGNVRFQDNYAQAAKKPANPSKEVKYTQRRLAIMVHIPEVDNNADRLHHIVLEINEFIKTARKKNPKFRLRKFNDITVPSILNRKKWRTSLNSESSSDFQEYVQGYYPFTPPRGGAYRFRINTVMDEDITLSTFLDNVTHDWGQKDTRSISDIKAQRIWDPVKLGYLMRAPRYLTHSYDLVKSLETAAKKKNTA